MKRTIIFLIGTAMVSCTTLSTGRRQLRLMPEAQMQSLGQQSFEKMESNLKPETDLQVNKFVECVTDHLLRAIDENPEAWEVKVFVEDQANAFALPGNRIGIYTGMLKIAQDQDQLAAVIGHEIGHVRLHHANERVSQNLLVDQGLKLADVTLLKNMNEKTEKLVLAGLGLGATVGILLPYSREQESEADRVGLEIMAKAGFEPLGAVALWRRMASKGPPEFLSTHPDPKERRKILRKQVAKVRLLMPDEKPSCERPESAPPVSKFNVAVPSCSDSNPMCHHKP